MDEHVFKASSMCCMLEGFIYTV